MEGKDTVGWNLSNAQGAQLPSSESAPRKPRGFAAMDPERQKQIASKGGRTSHQRGTGHEWNSEAARAAGRKGGLAGKGKVRRRRKKSDLAAAAANPAQPASAAAPATDEARATESVPRVDAA